MENDSILVEKDGHVGRLIFNRPDKSNAMKFSDATVLKERLYELEQDDDIKVIVLKGKGRSFCAGHDYDDIVKSYGLDRKDENGKYIMISTRARLQIDRKLSEDYMAIQYSQKPVIAQVHGACVGYGMYLAEVVDLVVCAENARFSHAEQRLGLAGNTWNLNTQILLYGPKKVREMLLFGSEFDGKEAVGLGLANLAVPEDELDVIVQEWAERVASNPRDALIAGKAMYQMALDSLGATQQFIRGYMGHTLGTTNLSFEKDEFNFFRERRDRGTKQAFRNRDAQYDRD
jgi:enoyl-CoA hydratase